MIDFYTYNALLDAINVSRELSLHPIHLNPDKEGNLPPSALVPFCSYQGTFLGHEMHEIGNITVCDKFQPIVIENHLCYSLDMSKLDKKPSKSGKSRGLFLLVDSNPYQLNTPKNDFGKTRADTSFKMYVHTLEQYSAQESGSYGMNALKHLTGTKSFKELPIKQRECLVHNRDECQNQKFLGEVQKSCKCTPWNQQNGNLDDFTYCGPDKEDCVNNQTLKDKNCLVPCTGLHADISEKESLRKNSEEMTKGNYLSHLFLQT